MPTPMNCTMLPHAKSTVAYHAAHRVMITQSQSIANCFTDRQLSDSLAHTCAVRLKLHFINLLLTYWLYNTSQQIVLIEFKPYCIASLTSTVKVMSTSEVHRRWHYLPHLSTCRVEFFLSA